MRSRSTLPVLALLLMGATCDSSLPTEAPQLQHATLWADPIAGAPRVYRGAILSALEVDAGHRYGAQLHTAAYTCAAWQDSRSFLRTARGAYEASITCRPGAVLDEVEVRFSTGYHDAIERREDGIVGAWTTLETTFRPDGTADRPGVEIEAEGTLRFRFYVTEEEPGDKPFFELVEPERVAPGWDRPITLEDELAYFDAAGADLVPSLPLMPHERLSFFASEPLISLGVEVSPDDLDDGIVWEPHPTDLPPPFAELSTQSNRGLVPGQRYDLRFVGERGLSATARTLPTQSPSGAPIGPWLGDGVSPDSPLVDADARYVFNTWPVRIEAPRHDEDVVGLRDIDAAVDGSDELDDTIAFPIEVIVPDDLENAFTWRVTFERDGFSDVTSGTWRPGTPDTLNQARTNFNVERHDLFPDFSTSELEGDALLRVELFEDGGELVAVDEVRARYDFLPPAAPPMQCPPNAPPGDDCTFVDDPDERDCNLRRFCVPADEAVAAVLTLCGTTQRVELEPTGDGLRCATNVSFAGTPDNAPLQARLVDVAGNESGDVPFVRDGDYCESAGSREVTTDLSPVGHAVDGAATPLVVTQRTSRLGLLYDLRRWVGGRWDRQTVTASSVGSWVARGRIGAARFSDGSVLFCATARRRSTHDAGDRLDLRADIEFGSELTLIRVLPDGQVTSVGMNGKALGCAASATPAGDAIYVAAARSFAGEPSAMLVRCQPHGAGLDCEEDVGFRDALDARLMSFEPDVLVSVDRFVNMTGRGYVHPDGSLHEHGLYFTRYLPATRSLRVTYPVRQDRTSSLTLEADSFDADGAPLDPRPTFRTGAFAPRLATRPGLRFALIAGRYEERVLLGRPSPGGEFVFSARAETEASLHAWTLNGSGTVLDERELATLHLGSGPPPLAWPEGEFERLDAGTAAPRWPPIDVDPTERDVRVAFMTQPVAATDSLPAIFYRQDEGDFPGLRTVPVFVSDNARNFLSVSALREGRVLFSSPMETTLVDAPLHPTGTDQTGQALAMWVERREGTPVEASFAFASRHPRAAIRYVGDRGNQRLAPTRHSGSCALSARLAISDAATNLTPMLSPGFVLDRGSEWTTARLPDASLARHDAAIANATCALNASEGVTDDATFTRAVRDEVVAPFFGLLSNIQPSGQAAVLLSRRVLAVEHFPAGSLRPIINGTPFTFSFTEGSLSEVAEQLNVAAASTPSQPFASVHPTGDGSSRLMLTAWATREGSGGRLSIRSTGFARRIRLPVGVENEAIGAPVLDAAHGESGDRFRPCDVATPCVPRSGGTCNLPQDCLATDRALLGQAFEGVALRSGRPPLRPATNVCVPAAQIGRGDDVCARTGPPFRGGTAGSYPSFTSGRADLTRPFSCPDNDSLVWIPGEEFPSCASCDDGGVARRCTTDAECGDNRGCTTGRCPATFLCTHLDIDWLGVPAGEGFCAAPQLCTGPTCTTRSVDGVAEPLSITRGAHAVGARDFEPTDLIGDFGGTECTLEGCAQCLGGRQVDGSREDRPNGYCHADADCPAAHRCATPAATGGILPPAPICVLRPLLENGRLVTIVDELENASGVEGVDELADAVLGGLLALKQNLSASLSSLSMPTHVFYEDGDTRVLIHSIAIDVEGATASWVSTPSSTPGDYAPAVGELSVQLLVGPNPRLTGHLRTVIATDIEDLEVADEVRITLPVQMVDIRLRPYVEGGRIRLRHERTYLRNGRATNPNNAPLSRGSDLGIDFDDPELDFLRALVVDVLSRGLGLFDDPLSFDLGTFSSELGELDAVGNIFAPLINNLIEQPYFGSLFGVDRTTLASEAELHNVRGIPMSDDGATAGSIESVFRGELFSSSTLFIGLSAPPTAAASLCCIAREPDPRCLETNSNEVCLDRRGPACR